MSLKNVMNSQDEQDAATSASENIDSDPSRRSDASTSRRKRKRESMSTVTNVSKKPRRRTRRGEQEQYIELLNEVIQDANNRDDFHAKSATLAPSADTTAPARNPSSYSLSPSQFGVTRWSKSAKEMLFEGLASHTRHGLPHLARLTQKSIPDINDYLAYLRRVAREQQLRGRHDRGGTDFADMPAAVEVGEDIERALEKRADAVEDAVRGLEEDEERKVWGKFWLIDAAVAEELDSQVSEKMLDGTRATREEDDNHDSDRDDHEPILPNLSADVLTHDHLCATATLLRLPMLLHLSQRLFMNPGPPSSSQNWFYLSSPPGSSTPAIRATACWDFLTLVVELTRKIISTALFQATSRLRAMDYEDRKKSPQVNESDVRIAVKLLTMDKWAREEKGEYWVGLARRNHLRVFDIDPRNDRLAAMAFRKDLVIPMAYEKVEERLRDEPDQSSGDTNIHMSVIDHSRQGVDETLPEYTDSEDSPNTTATPSASGPLDQLEASGSESEEEQASALDAEASEAEALKLWELLMMDPPESTRTTSGVPVKVKREEHGGAKQRPKAIEKDWTETIDWRGEWERYGYLLQPAHFTKRKGEVGVSETRDADENSGQNNENENEGSEENNEDEDQDDPNDNEESDECAGQTDDDDDDDEEDNQHQIPSGIPSARAIRHEEARTASSPPQPQAPRRTGRATSQRTQLVWNSPPESEDDAESDEEAEEGGDDGEKGESDAGSEEGGTDNAESDADVVGGEEDE